MGIRQRSQAPFSQLRGPFSESGRTSDCGGADRFVLILDQPVPWVGFVSPPLPADARLERVVALDAAGKTAGTRQRPFLDYPRWRPRAG